MAYLHASSREGLRDRREQMRQEESRHLPSLHALHALPDLEERDIYTFSLDVSLKRPSLSLSLSHLHSKGHGIFILFILIHFSFFSFICHRRPSAFIISILGWLCALWLCRQRLLRVKRSWFILPLSPSPDVPEEIQATGGEEGEESERPSRLPARPLPSRRRHDQEIQPRRAFCRRTPQTAPAAMPLFAKTLPGQHATETALPAMPAFFRAFLS